MQIVLLGPPGSGKGTMAQVMVEKYNLPHISTGDIFRQNIKDQTELGRKASAYIEKGALVPDEITIAMVQDRLSQESCRQGFILDGFPRTVPQARALTDMLDEMNCPLTVVLNVQVSKESIIERVSGRRICSNCGASFNTIYMPTKVEGICDICGGKLIQRKDDKPETVLKRFNTYEEQTAPLIDFYSDRGLIAHIDNEGEIGSALGAVDDAIQRRVASRGSA